ncbi:MAG: hypothetical protein PHQ89_00660 [Bacilli bacterium]|nr:hypothetical protein [Bacilli bacterium]
MKKVLIVPFCLFILTGCTNLSLSPIKTISCAKTTVDEDTDYETKEASTIKYRDNELLYISSQISMETDPEYLDFSLSMYDSVMALYDDIDGIDYTVEKEGNNKLITTFVIDYENMDIEEFTNTMNELVTDMDSGDGTDTVEADLDYIKDNKPLYDLYLEDMEADGYVCK